MLQNMVDDTFGEALVRERKRHRIEIHDEVRVSTPTLNI